MKPTNEKPNNLSESVVGYLIRCPGHRGEPCAKQACSSRSHEGGQVTEWIHQCVLPVQYYSNDSCVVQRILQIQKEVGTKHFRNSSSPNPEPYGLCWRYLSRERDSQDGIFSWDDGWWWVDGDWCLLWYSDLFFTGITTRRMQKASFGSWIHNAVITSISPQRFVWKRFLLRSWLSPTDQQI